MKNKKTKIIMVTGVVICALLIGFFAVIDYVNSSKKYEDSAVLMGAVVSLKINGKNAEETGKKINSRIAQIECNEISRKIENSEISKLNKFKKITTDNKKIIDYLNESLKICNDSNGALDISVGALTDLWNVGEENFVLPKESAVSEKLKSVDYSKIKIESNSIEIDENQSLDLGAVGKGIACDEAKEILEKSEIDDAIISVGGSILLWNKDNSDNNTFNVGIRNPLGNDSDYMAILKLNNCCVSTSGNYEKYSVVNGKKYHHIINAETGYPAENDLLSVTVVCSSGLDSDGLSTACYVSGYEKSLKLLKKYNAEAVFIFKNKTVKITEGIKNKFTLENNDFSLIK